MFKELIVNAVQDAFDVIGDLKTTVNYVQFSSGAYDIDTASITYDHNYQVGIGAVFTGFSDEEKDDEVQVLFDRKVLIPAKTFELVLDQATEDSIIDPDGREWNVVRYLGVTGGSLHKFHVRAA
ncbi:MAG: hypothetical protein RIA09_15725 [Hoeflea sp.]|jgi:hypothetical protein|uniref:hypothetical protein n=1 Tax=Hoeflea sp. TaxID=1940281 RepID=UPI0032EF8D99